MYWFILLLALAEGGWLAFDGAYALVTGDYVTPRSGPYASQLGPWSKVVSRVGLQPRSTAVKVIHLLLGACWLVVMVGYGFRAPWAWWGMVACAVAGLWYLPFGTLLSVVQIVLLLLPAVRASFVPTN